MHASKLVAASEAGQPTACTALSYKFLAGGSIHQQQHLFKLLPVD
jgi:hypothetical protein